MNANFKKWIDAHPAYDIDVINFGIFLKYPIERVRGDHPSWEHYVSFVQERKGLSYDDSVQLIRKLIALDLESYLDGVLGKRS